MRLQQKLKQLAELAWPGEEFVLDDDRNPLVVPYISVATSAIVPPELHEYLTTALPYNDTDIGSWTIMCAEALVEALVNAVPAHEILPFGYVQIARRDADAYAVSVHDSRVYYSYAGVETLEQIVSAAEQQPAFDSIADFLDWLRDQL